jgi:hypothetical protein
MKRHIAFAMLYGTTHSTSPAGGPAHAAHSSAQRCQSLPPRRRRHHRTQQQLRRAGAGRCAAAAAKCDRGPGESLHAARHRHHALPGVPKPHRRRSLHLGRGERRRRRRRDAKRGHGRAVQVAVWCTAGVCDHGGWARQQGAVALFWWVGVTKSGVKHRDPGCGRVRRPPGAAGWPLPPHLSTSTRHPATLPFPPPPAWPRVCGLDGGGPGSADWSASPPPPTPSAPTCLLSHRALRWRPSWHLSLASPPVPLDSVSGRVSESNLIAPSPPRPQIIIFVYGNGSPQPPLPWPPLRPSTRPHVRRPLQPLLDQALRRHLLRDHRGPRLRPEPRPRGHVCKERRQRRFPVVPTGGPRQGGPAAGAGGAAGHLLSRGGTIPYSPDWLCFFGRVTDRVALRTFCC